ncbi:MAG: dephospho-CoA kinase [Verrucomicrobiota bacterium]
MTIGLTGGMGCGKSTVAALFEEEGFRSIDADRIVRERLLVDPGIVRMIGERWGDGVLDGHGRVDRARLAAVVFADDAERLWLESVLHPRVKAAWEEAVATDPAADWVVEVPLLFEKGLEKGFDFTVCVAASSDVQLARLTERGIPQPLAGQRISKQLPLAQKQDFADVVVFNDGSPAFLQRQVRQVAASLRAAAQRKG